MTVVCSLMVWVIFYSLGEYFSKLWTTAPTVQLTLLILFCYGVDCLAWLPALRSHGSLTVLTTVFAIVGTLAGVAIGIWLFKEPITTKQSIGIGLAFVALILLYSG